LRTAFIAAIVAVLCLACGGSKDNGSSANNQTPGAITTTAPGASPAATSAIASFEGVCCAGLRVRVTGIQLSSGNISAHIEVENGGDFGSATLQPGSVRAIFFTEENASRWRDAYPPIYASGTLKTQLAQTAHTALPLRVTQGETAAAILAAGRRWTATVEGEGAPPDAAALLFVIDEVRMEMPYLGTTNVFVTSSDATRPFIGLKGEVRVMPAPTVAPFIVSASDAIRIPKIGLDAPLALKNVGQDGNMPNPDDASIAIYDFALFGPLYGGVPGSGNAVFAGLYSRQDGPRLFVRLLELAPGDTVEVGYQGQSRSFTVTMKCVIPNSGFEKIIERSQTPTITLLVAGNGVQYFVRGEQQAGAAAQSCPEGASSFSGTTLPNPNR
jgi:hypothetical protein